jgi:hypothetical protein
MSSNPGRDEGGQESQSPRDRQPPRSEPPGESGSRGQKPAEKRRQRPEHQPGGGRRPPRGGVEKELLVDWARFTGILFALAAAAIGLFFVLSDAVGEGLLEAQGQVAQQLGVGFSQFVLLLPFVVTLFVAPFVGASFAPRIDHPDEEVFRVAFASVAVGAVVLCLISTILMSTTVDNASINVGGLLINTVLAALVSGGVAAGGAWAVRNELPA